jgi:hypothetical protein
VFLLFLRVRRTNRKKRQGEGRLKKKGGCLWRLKKKGGCLFFYSFKKQLKKKTDAPAILVIIATDAPAILVIIATDAPAILVIIALPPAAIRNMLVRLFRKKSKNTPHLLSPLRPTSQPQQTKMLFEINHKFFALFIDISIFFLILRPQHLLIWHTLSTEHISL